MKKVLITVALAATCILAQAQSKKKAVVKPAAPDTTFKYHVDISPADLHIILESAKFGFVSWLHTTLTPMNNEDASKQYFAKIYNDVTEQVNPQKRKFDSLQRAKADTSKKVIKK